VGIHTLPAVFKFGADEEGVVVGDGAVGKV
jgi:hypothetical protein